MSSRIALHRIVLFGFLLLGAWVLTLPADRVAAATTYMVGSNSDIGTAGTAGQCLDPNNTACRLRDALAYANSGTDTIVFNTTGRGTITVGRTLKVTSGVVIAGPTSGTGVSVAGGTAGSVFRFDPNDLTTSGISNLTIANGNTLGGESSNGGGIVNETTLTVTNTTLVNNKATGGNGGGIENSGTLTVINSVLSGNTADFGGGGIGNYGTLTVTNSRFTNNTTAGGISATGGGIANDRGSVTVMSSTFSGNNATGGGGGIFNDTGRTLTVTNSTLSGNTAVSGTGSGTGGGIANFGTLTVTDSTLSGNRTDYEGGAIYNEGGTVTATNSTLANNSADQFGGGVMNRSTGATVTLTNTTVVGNAVGNVANRRGSAGGGISGAGMLFLTNTIVAGNTSFGMPFDINGVQTTNQYSLVGGNPLLSALASNGGPTQTMAPLPGSPAIGAGDPSVCDSTTIPAAAPVGGKDQRGVTRPSSLCAIGAVEPLLSAISPTSGSITGGANVTLTGAGFASGATVSIGGAGCTNVVIVNSTTLRCTASVHTAGTVDVKVTVGSQTGTLTGGYTYGVVNPLPFLRPPAGTGGNPAVLPAPRPGGTIVGTAPSPVPAPRP